MAAFPPWGPNCAHTDGDVSRPVKMPFQHSSSTSAGHVWDGQSYRFRILRPRPLPAAQAFGDYFPPFVCLLFAHVSEAGGENALVRLCPLPTLPAPPLPHRRPVCSCRCPPPELLWSQVDAKFVLEQMERAPELADTARALRTVPVDQSEYAADGTMVRDPTTWSILQHEGPNHLGLWYNAAP